ncbi:MAG: zf-HC2 domain-containing protein [Chloroflexota bacterium]|nr:zf-HC2 domain-containing protein [Chloroflexota bacterium]
MSDIRGQHGAARPRYRVATLGGSHIDDVDAAGYALGALEPAERQVIEHHLRTCAACAERVSHDVRAVGMLPFAVSSHLKPAPDVKATLFARIAHSQQATTAAALPTARTRPPESSIQTIPSSRPGAGGASSPVGDPSPRYLAASASASRSGWMTAIVATPLLLALVLVGGWSLQLRSQVTAQETAMSSQTSELTSLRATLANFASGDVQTVQLMPEAAAPQAEGQFVLSSDQTEAIVQVDLNTRDAGGSAQILMNNNGSIEPIGNVTLNERGQGQVMVTFDQPLTESQRIQVQAVPVDPSVAASSELLLSGPVNGMSDPGFGANTTP